MSLTARGPHPPSSGCCCHGSASAPSMSRLVSYSLMADERRRSEHAFQFELSVSSLRASNRSIPVVLFTHGPLAPEIAQLCSRFEVMVADQGAYADRLAALSPQGGPAMVRYPVLHKHLNFAELAAAGARQVLCCDLDTLFLQDVEAIFDRYGEADFVAREEVCSGRSIHGADRAFIDEALLGRIAQHLGRSPVAPMNLGVVLYNRGLVARLSDVMATFVDDAWRLMTGLTLHQYPNVREAGNETFPWMADVRRRASHADRQRALPYPSTNGWIVEEVAWWLALGATPGLKQADFAAHDVAQNGEVLYTPLDRSTWAMCHYYSHNLQRVVEWLREPPLPTPQAFRNPTRHRRTAQPSAHQER